MNKLGDQSLKKKNQAGPPISPILSFLCDSILLWLGTCPFLWIPYYPKFITVIAIICVALTVSLFSKSLCLLSARIWNGIRTRRRGQSQGRLSAWDHCPSHPCSGSGEVKESRYHLQWRLYEWYKGRGPDPREQKSSLKNLQRSLITYRSKIYGKCPFPVAWEGRKREGVSCECSRYFSWKKSDT